MRDVSKSEQPELMQAPIPPTLDLRDMLRRHVIRRSLAHMEAAAERRRRALESAGLAAYTATVREAVAGFYGDLPVGPSAPPPRPTLVSRHEKDGAAGAAGYAIENVLFESFLGWQVNASVYVPLAYEPPYPAVVIPVGHSGKQFASYQLPAQYFAQCGYLALLFDPPGQAGEKQQGNDHFRDGVRPYLVGQSSSRYFVADALRCIDYLTTRDDVDLSNGVAMTGVSGGGTTTSLAAHLDPRIAVVGLSCCLAPVADLDIRQSYAGCPETHMWRRYAEGIDDTDLVCAMAPRPVMVMAGRDDEVFHLQDTTRLAEEVRACYRAAGVEERYSFYVDEGGHGYSIPQAQRFAAFMNRWLLEDPERALPSLSAVKLGLDPYEELRCYPSAQENMYTLSLARARELAEERPRGAEAVRRAAREIAQVRGRVGVPVAEESGFFQVWTHHWQQVLLRPEPDIELPGTWFGATAEEGRKPAVLLHFDDQHRNRPLYRAGILSQAVGFLNRAQPDVGVSYFGVDLRGWGDSAPAMYPYETADWGGTDRTLAYMSNALGDPLMAMRIRDGLAALAYLRHRPDVDPERIVITGSGLGGVVALHVAAIDGAVAGLLVWESPFSFMALLEEEDPLWPADLYLPRVLLHYDLPDLVRVLDCPARVYDPLDGMARPLAASERKRLNRGLGDTVYVATATASALAASVREVLGIEVGGA